MVPTTTRARFLQASYLLVWIDARHRVNDLGNRFHRQCIVFEEQYSTILLRRYVLDEIVVVGHDRSIRRKRERCEIAVTRPFAEFRNRIDVFDVVSQRFEATFDLVFYVLV